MHINLSEEFTNYIKNCVESGYYNNSAEVVRDALRHMIENKKRNIPNAETLAAFREVEEGQTMKASSTSDLFKKLND